jgi:hypothetical protein
MLDDDQPRSLALTIALSSCESLPNEIGHAGMCAGQVPSASSCSMIPSVPSRKRLVQPRNLLWAAVNALGFSDGAVRHVARTLMPSQRRSHSPGLESDRSSLFYLHGHVPPPSALRDVMLLTFWSVELTAFLQPGPCRCSVTVPRRTCLHVPLATRKLSLSCPVRLEPWYRRACRSSGAKEALEGPPEVTQPLGARLLLKLVHPGNRAS